MKNNFQEVILRAIGKIEIERLLAILNLGICIAIENEVMSLEEAEFYLYSPYTLEQLQKMEVSQQLIDIIHLGTELEDIKTLLPEELNTSLSEIKVESIKFLKSLHSEPSEKVFRKKWIQT
jgi:Protein of unknown function (DUF3969)